MRSAQLSCLVAVALAATMLFCGPAQAGSWSATIYGGPASNSRASDIVDGRGRFSGGMIGLAIDRDIFNLGWGVSFGAELQVTHYLFGNNYTTGALGIGFRFHDILWGHNSLAIYSGPSYALDPPHVPDNFYGPSYKMRKFLNFIGVEFAVPVPWDPRHWDAVLRLYHRSGAWGLYSINVDEGSMVGIGLRAKF